MNTIKIPKKFLYLLSISIIVNLLLFAYIVITTWRFDREILLLEKKIEILEIHVFPEKYRNPETENDPGV